MRQKPIFNVHEFTSDDLERNMNEVMERIVRFQNEIVSIIQDDVAYEEAMGDDNGYTYAELIGNDFDSLAMCIVRAGLDLKRYKNDWIKTKKENQELRLKIWKMETEAK